MGELRRQAKPLGTVDRANPRALKAASIERSDAIRRSEGVARIRPNLPD
jgi:hypothetical protein